MRYTLFGAVLLFAGALSVSAYSYGDLDISIDGDEYTIGSGDAQLDVNVGKDSVQTDYQAGGQSASINVTNDTNTVTGTVSGNAAGNTAGNAQTGGVVNISSSGKSLKIEVEGSDLSSEEKRAIVNLEGNTLTTIKTDDDLKAYNSVVIETNPNISTISSDDGSVEITYRHPAKFLGIWRTSLNATARVENNERVSIQLPWYSFLFSTGKGDVEKTINVNLENDAMVQVNSDGGASADLTVQNEARAINIVTSQIGGQGSATISGSNGNSVDFGF